MALLYCPACVKATVHINKRCCHPDHVHPEVPLHPNVGKVIIPAFSPTKEKVTNHKVTAKPITSTKKGRKQLRSKWDRERFQEGGLGIGDRFKVVGGYRIRLKEGLKGLLYEDVMVCHFCREAIEMHNSVLGRVIAGKATKVESVVFTSLTQPVEHHVKEEKVRLEQYRMRKVRACQGCSHKLLETIDESLD
jgi:hypothetical protein